MSNSIKVVARFRPQNRTEIELGGEPIVKFESEDTCSLDVSAFRCRSERGCVY
jgi:kinesin family protein 5